MQTLCGIFIGESNLKQNIKETYLQNACAHHYFIKFQNKRKVKGSTLRELLKWKKSCIYAPIGNLHTKIMQEEHDMYVVRHHGEKTMTMAIGNGSIARDEGI